MRVQGDQEKEWRGGARNDTGEWVGDEGSVAERLLSKRFDFTIGVRKGSEEAPAESGPLGAGGFVNRSETRSRAIAARNSSSEPSD